MARPRGFLTTKYQAIGTSDFPDVDGAVSWHLILIAGCAQLTLACQRNFSFWGWTGTEIQGLNGPPWINCAPTECMRLLAGKVCIRRMIRMLMCNSETVSTLDRAGAASHRKCPRPCPRYLTSNVAGQPPCRHAVGVQLFSHACRGMPSWRGLRR